MVLKLKIGMKGTKAITIWDLQSVSQSSAVHSNSSINCFSLLLTIMCGFNSRNSKDSTDHELSTKHRKHGKIPDLHLQHLQLALHFSLPWVPLPADDPVLTLTGSEETWPYMRNDLQR